MRTWSGAQAPLPGQGDGEVRFEDVVIQLGRAKRFGAVGQLPEYSVLHHSFLVALLWLRAGFQPEWLHFALLHDAHEYVTGDIPGPVKAAIRAAVNRTDVDGLKAVEDHLDQQIRHAVLAHSIRLTEAERILLRHRIKVVDLAALLIEAPRFAAPMCNCRVDVPQVMWREVAGLLHVAGYVTEATQLADHFGCQWPHPARARP